MKLDNLLKLYAVTDRRWLKENQTLYYAVEQAILGGVTIVQLREKNISTTEFIKEAREIQILCKKYNIPLIINDNIEVFKKINADGIHLGQSDLNAKIAREIIGKNKILGISASNIEEAKTALKNGADYIGVGAIFNTSTKNDATNVSKEELKKICNNIDIPVVAIGGITLNNIKDLKGTGINGVAIVSEIFSSNNIKNTCIELKKEIEKIL